MYKSYLIDIGVDEKRIVLINFEDNNNKHLLNSDVLHEYIVSKLDKNNMNYIFFR